MVELGTFGGATSSARDINNHGQIVGFAQDGSGAFRAFLSDAGAAMVDLNTLLPADSGWVLLSANAINDAGQIVGEGTFNGDPRAFLLTPPVASDTTPPVVSSVTTTPNNIWPPKHQMVDVTVGVVASDDSGETPVCAVVSVASSEPSDAGGDGNTSADTEVVGPTQVRVRAERSGPFRCPRLYRDGAVHRRQRQCCHRRGHCHDRRGRRCSASKVKEVVRQAETAAGARGVSPCPGACTTKASA